MADDWSAFPDAPGHDPWADFPDAEPKRKPLKVSRGKVVEPNSPPLKDRDAYFEAHGRGKDLKVSGHDASGPLYDVAAVDGDTLKTDEARVRVWGADAPELAQQGWDRNGNPVPIGQQSKDWLQGEVNNAGLVNLGSVQGSSYGRLVGPVTLDGNDAALSSIRTGNALAAPTFVHDNPDYRFKLVEAERLARMNHLGPVNDTSHQTPAEHRANPEWKPERETIAQFWDTPTPLQGMKPEAEKQYLTLQANGSADQIVKFATAQGLDMDPDKVAEWVAWRDKQKAEGKPFRNYANYQRGPEVMQQVVDGAFRAGGRAYSQGFLAGGLDEGGAIFDTLLPNIPGLMTNGLRENVWNSDRRVADIFVNNLDQNAAILRGDQYAHPNATTGGEVAGALTSGVVIPYGQGARTAAELARVGAVYGAASGFLGTDGGATERLKGAVIGAPVGAVLNAGIGKAIEYGAPVIGRGVQRLLGRDGTKPAEAAGKVAGEYASDNAFSAAEALPEGSGSDVWPGRVVGGESGATSFAPYDSALDAPVSGPAWVREGGESEARDLRVADGRGPALDSQPNQNQGRWEEFQRDGSDRFLIYHGPEGQQANVHVSIGDDGVADISIDPFSKDANRFGPGVVRQAARDLKQLYPEIRAFRGERESGANPGHVQSMEMGESGGRGNATGDSTLGGAFSESTIGMEADSPYLSGEPRQRDYIDLSAPARARPLLDPATDAQRMAAAERVHPRDVLPIASNEVDGPEELAASQVGRFVEARVPNERSQLSRGTVRNWMGKEVPKVGPTDMVGWLRLRGGLQDQGGELSHMGLTNAARRGLDHVGQEARFGPLVNNDTGMNLDDAAQVAWEAGFFPERTERPSVNDFLDALHDTYNGGANRRFLPEDYAELERYGATQAERYDLEQRQNEVGGPVYDDRSVPADDAAPFAPPEAYEEWPSDAIKRVGNVDVTKLDTPQDIARALRTTHYAMGGMDAATRGRVTHAETERLASDLGMTADDLLARRKGQALNAEQALAARQILAKSANELVNLARKIQRVENPGDEEAAAFQRALMRHAAIQEQVSGATAEAGRALSQFRMMADSRSVPSEVLAGIRDAGGGQKRIKQAADLLLDAIEGPPGRFNTVVRKASSPRFSDKLAELYINNLLSGPQTHVVNAVSNTMTALSQIPEHALAAAIGGARKAVMRKEVDRVMGGELSARLFGLMQGTREGAELFARALKTGETSDTFSKIAGNDMRAISGVKGEIVRIPGRLLNSADEFFKGINRRAEINALAYRQAHREGLKGEALTARIGELSANPTEAIELRGLDFARYMTFQRPLGGLGQRASSLTREYPLLRPIITFVRTPANLLKFATERSPAALALPEWRADIKAGGARRDLAIARMTLGTGFAAAFYIAALDGRVTGSAPSDETKKRFMYADGWQPYSVRIGDTWVSYSRLDPFAIQLGVAADLALRSEGMSDKQLDNYAMLSVASIMRQMGDKTWLSGVTKFSQALNDPERYGSAYLRSLGGALVVPNVLAQTARTIDPVSRERKTMADELQSRIPGLSDGLLPKRDIWGRPIVSDDDVGPDLLNPFRQSHIDGDPVNAAMLAIGARTAPPSKQHTVGGKKVDWTPEEFDRLQELAGRQAYSGIAALISDPAWEHMPNAARLKAADKVFRAARENARNTVLGTPPAKESPRAPANDDPWSAFPDAKGGAAKLMGGGEWDAFPDAPSRDVMGDLQQRIPGIQFTSGFRDPAYNESLRARGYHPATNSEHLDGSALDMLPPPGKSLGWLMREVKRYDPKARLLVHDGHLHAGFNGYYKAPKLDGMAAR